MAQISEGGCPGSRPDHKPDLDAGKAGRDESTVSTMTGTREKGCKVRLWLLGLQLVMRLWHTLQLLVG